MEPAETDVTWLSVSSSRWTGCFSEDLCFKVLNPAHWSDSIPLLIACFQKVHPLVYSILSQKITFLYVFKITSSNNSIIQTVVIESMSNCRVGRVHSKRVYINIA